MSERRSRVNFIKTTILGGLFFLDRLFVLAVDAGRRYQLIIRFDVDKPHALGGATDNADDHHDHRRLYRHRRDVDHAADHVVRCLRVAGRLAGLGILDSRTAQHVAAGSPGTQPGIRDLAGRATQWHRPRTGVAGDFLAAALLASTMKSLVLLRAGLAK
mgnify:CR=1 FL=1